MTKKDLNQSPYFDDYNEDKKYYRILFKPGRAVQARELTQIQSMIQKQIDRVGNHLFKNGAQVLPGSDSGVVYSDNVNTGFIKIPQSPDLGTNTPEEIEFNWLNKTISNELGVEATVVGYRPADSFNEVRLFVTYAVGSSSVERITFQKGQNISTNDLIPLTAQIINDDFSVGQSYSVSIERSVYFFNNNFVLVDPQTIFIIPQNESDKESWLKKPTTNIVLKFTESFVTADEDESLYDNSLGTTNYTAPGADRLRIEASLEQRLPDIFDELGNPEFIEDPHSAVLVEIRNGTVTYRVSGTDLNVPNTILARRTYDESGDYVVKPFEIEIKDFLNENDNNGVYDETLFYFSNLEDAETASTEIFLLDSPLAYEDLERGYYLPGDRYEGTPTSFKSLCRNFLTLKIGAGKGYVKGYEIEKISTNLVNLPKSKSLEFKNNVDISTPLGDHYIIKNVKGMVEFSTYDTVELYSGRFEDINVDEPSGTSEKLGTARVLSFDFFRGEAGNYDTGEYRLFLFEIKLNPGKNLSQVKSVYSSGANGGTTFRANLILNEDEMKNTVNTLSEQVEPDVLKNVIRGSGNPGWLNGELTFLTVGDLVSVGIGDEKRYYLVEEVVSENTLYVQTTDEEPFPVLVDQPAYYVYSSIRTNSDNRALIFKLPDNNVATLIQNLQYDVNFTTKTQYFDRLPTNQPDESGLITIEPEPTGTTFEDFSINSFAVVNQDTGKWFKMINSTSAPTVSGEVSVEVQSNSAKFRFNSTDKSNNYCIVAPVVRSSGSVSEPRKKILIPGTFKENILGERVYEGNYVVSDSTREIYLNKCDILRVTRIVESPSPSVEPSNKEILPSDFGDVHRDITALYLLDNGQREYYYDVGRVVLRPGVPVPKGKIRVEFDYFEHSQNGSYFCVDSYPINQKNSTDESAGLIDYSEVPRFKSSDGTRYDLTSAIDFRPRSIDSGTSSQESLNFVNYLPLPRDNFTTDYSFYLSRIDLLYLDKTGDFYLKLGSPSVNPIRPKDPETGMTIYELSLSPYTAEPGYCIPRRISNRRYTMRDIGKLEKRIKTLEYYTSLSLLEIDTEKLKIKDALGNDKFKNGYLVDNFSSFNGDMSHQDYSVAVDTIQRVARPAFKTDFVKLLQVEPEIQYYQKTGDLITLPYEKVTLTEQKSATKVSNINPYNTSTFIGFIKLTPWNDEWRDTENRDPLLIKDDSAYQAAAQNFGPDGTRIDYVTTTTSWEGIEYGERERLGFRLEVAGHDIWENFKPERLAKIKQRKWMRVPDGYLNAGEKVPVAMGGDDGISSQVVPVFATEQNLTGTKTTTNFTSSIDLESGYTEPQSLGSRLVETAVIEYMRSIYVYFEGKGFMPGVRLYAFFNDVDVNEDCALRQDGVTYDDINLPNFGEPLVCDANGRINGVFKIPNRDGKRFKTGEAFFRLTTSKTNSRLANSASESKFIARGYLDVFQETQLSTRIVNISPSTSDGGDTTPVSVSLGTIHELGQAKPRDPIAQSFFVYGKSGVFITDIDVFFYSADKNLPVTLEVRPIGPEGFPTNQILPFGTVVVDAADVITNVIDTENNTFTVDRLGAEYNTKQTQEEKDDYMEDYDAKSEYLKSQINGPWKSITGRTLVPGEPVDIELNSTVLNTPSDEFIPTKFTFDSPIYLSPGQQYCFVLLTDSKIDYNVWISETGADELTQGNSEPRFRESGDPNKQIGTDIDPTTYEGTYFKSENGLTWVPDPRIDIKFKIHKCEFDTTNVATVEYINQELPSRKLTLDPLEFKEGSDLVRVLHPNHGMPDETPASKVVFTPVYDRYLSGYLQGSSTFLEGTGVSELFVNCVIQHPITREQRVIKSIFTDPSDGILKAEIETVFLADNMSSPTFGFKSTSYQFPTGDNLGGIPSQVLLDYRGFTISNTELDYYIIDINEYQDTPILASSSGRFGGSRISATENKRFDEITIMSQPLFFPNTDISWSLRTTTSSGPHHTAGDTYKLTTPRSIEPNEKIIFDRPMHISSWINQQTNLQVPAGPSLESHSGSIKVIASLSSKDPNISPVIDQSRLSASMIANRLDTPYGLLSESNSDPSVIINSIFDNYQCLPTNDIPTVSDMTDVYFIPGNPTILKTANEIPAVHLSKLDVGKYLTIEGVDLSFTDKLVTSVQYTPNGVPDSDFTGEGEVKYCEIHIDYDSSNSGLSEGFFTSDESNKIIQKDRFIDEIAPNFGSTSSKYISRQMVVSRFSNALKVIFDASRDPSCQIDLYYRLKTTVTEDLNNVNWTKAVYNVDDNGVFVSKTPEPNSSPTQFSTYESTLINLPDFVGAQCKIVMRGGNTSRPPLIRDFRMIILDE